MPENPYYELWMIHFHHYFNPDLLKIWGPFALVGSLLGALAFVFRKFGLRSRHDFGADLRDAAEYAAYREPDAQMAYQQGWDLDEYKRIYQNRRARRDRIMNRAKKRWRR